MADLSISRIKRIARRAAREELDEQMADRPDQDTTRRDDPDEWAFSAMDGDDVMVAQEEQLATSEFVADKYDVDPRNCSTREEFEAKLANLRAE